ncbi:TIGR04141 family sporadically distributed protein [Streptomyces sp. 3214.6]|uniref:TIGR04141 family sporadically distributed protein n=1 Tax=Streptomyces sp. 3214.6 TaxID=1882757 RepID=UPI001E411ECD|nr:TIGR04141 family sporadically distributed protein [Streptomyces sp. 3214.6]
MPRTTASRRRLYRLLDVDPTSAAMLDALDLEQLSAYHADVHDPSEFLGVPALRVTFGVEKDEAAWCGELVQLTDEDVRERERRTGALLMIAVDSAVYAVGYDQGFRLLPTHLKDQSFGLSVAIRTIDPQHVRDFTANQLGAARTDISIVPGGTSVPTLGLRAHSRIVRSLGGYLDSSDLTGAAESSGRLGRPMTVEGGVGLHLKLGTTPDALIADIRTIAAVLENTDPHPDLAFVEHIKPVTAPALRKTLDEQLDTILGQPAIDSICSAVPAEHIDDYTRAAAYTIKIGDCAPFSADTFDLDYFLTRARIIKRGQRIEALRRGTVALYGRERASAVDHLATTSALKWIEAHVSFGSRKFCFLDGAWYEFGTTYLRALRETVAPLFPANSSLRLPAWQYSLEVNKKGKTVRRPIREATYNQQAAENRPGWVCLDQKNVNNPLKTTNAVEICDLLMPDGTLVLVKKAHDSAPLSHLCYQAHVAVELLQQNPSVRAQFARQVHIQSDGNRTLPEDFTPHRVVFAILLKAGEKLTPDTLFPFSLITLAQTAQALNARGVQVEVVGIEPTLAPAANGLSEAA